MTNMNQTPSLSEIENIGIQIVVKTLTVGEAIALYDERANPDSDVYEPELRQKYLELMAQDNNALTLLALAKRGIENQISFADVEIDEAAAAKYAIHGTELEEKMFGVMHEGYEEGEGEEEWDEDEFEDDIYEWEEKK